MHSQSTANSDALIRRDVFSSVILDTLDDGFLPEGLARDVSDFPDGTKLEIPTFGEVVVKDITEGEETPVDSIDTGRITLEITDHKGAGISITDELREDAYYISQFEAAAPGKMLYSLKEVYETDMLRTGEAGQTQGDANAINDWAHRYVASGANGGLSLEDFAYARSAFGKANLQDRPMIAIVDPITEYSFNRLTNLVNVSNNPHFEGMVETGFGKNMRFIRNIYGIDVYMSNRLPRVAAGEAIDTTAGVAAPSGNATTADETVACQFMVVGDDMVTPYMSAWRRQPDVEYDRNVPKRQDEYYMTTRYGFAMQRPQSLITVLASSTQP